MTDIDKLLAELEALERGATEGPWDSMFIGGPLNPKRIEVDEVGREGSPHITIRREQKFIDSGFFGEDGKFIAKSRNALPLLLKLIKKQREALRSTGLLAFMDQCAESVAGRACDHEDCKVYLKIQKTLALTLEDLE